MFTEFDLHLGADQKNISKDFVVITDTDIDGNFLLNHFISHFLQKNAKVCLFGLGQVQSHYAAACHKIGVNIQAAITKKQFVFVDTLRMLFDGFLADSSDSNHLFSSVTDTDSLKPLLELVKAVVSENAPSIVLIDDLCALVNIGISVQVIADFLHYCKTLTVERDITFVFLSHLNQDDPEYSLLHSWLKQYVTLEINVRALKSGYSKDLSGDMSITWDNRYHQTKQLHFKLLDKDVKLYALGTSSVVL